MSRERWTKTSPTGIHVSRFLAALKDAIVTFLFVVAIDGTFVLWSPLLSTILWPITIFFPQNFRQPILVYLCHTSTLKLIPVLREESIFLSLLGFRFVLPQLLLENIWMPPLSPWLGSAVCRQDRSRIRCRSWRAGAGRINRRHPSDETLKKLIE